jgi:hypothetical protein
MYSPSNVVAGRKLAKERDQQLARRNVMTLLESHSVYGPTTRNQNWYPCGQRVGREVERRHPRKPSVQGPVT